MGILQTPKILKKISDIETDLGEKVNEISWVSVKNFNAKGDGVTNDTTAIQNAIDYAYNNQIKGVMLPPGIYLVSQLTLKQEVSLFSHSKQGISGLSTQSVTIKSINNNTLNNIQDAIIVMQKASCLYGTKIDGNKTNNINVFSGVRMTDALCRVEKCNVSSFTGNGIIEGSMDGSVIDTTCGDNAFYGIHNYVKDSNYGSDMRFIGIRLMGNLDGALFEVGGHILDDIKSYLNYRDAIIFQNDIFQVGVLFCQENGRHGVTIKSASVNADNLMISDCGSPTKTSEYISSAIALVLDGAYDCNLKGYIRCISDATSLGNKGINLINSTKNNIIKMNCVSYNPERSLMEYSIKDDTTYYNEININGIDMSNKISMNYDPRLITLDGSNVPVGFTNSETGFTSVLTYIDPLDRSLCVKLQPNSNSSMKELTYQLNVTPGDKLSISLNAKTISDLSDTRQSLAGLILIVYDASNNSLYTSQLLARCSTPNVSSGYKRIEINNYTIPVNATYVKIKLQSGGQSGSTTICNFTRFLVIKKST